MTTTPPRTLASRLRTALAKPALLVFATLLCLGVLEIAFRTAGYRPLYETYSKPDLFWRYDPLLGWAHEANQDGVYVGPRPFPIEFHGRVHLNSLGLRGPELQPVPTGGYRVMFLGDSVVAGFEVDDDKNFAALLGKSLGAELGAPVQSINAGVRGYGTDQSYLYYREHGQALHPDLVVFQSSNNDFEDNTTMHRARRPFGKGAFELKSDGALELLGVPVANYPYCSGIRLDDQLRPVHIDTATSRAACWLESKLADHSALLTFVALRLQQNEKLVRKLNSLGTPREQAVDMSTHGDRAASTPASRLTGALILELARTVRKSGARFVLALSSVDLELLDVRALDAAGIERFELDEIESAGNPVTPTRKFDPRLHYKNDSHMNELGHAREAALLQPILMRQLRAIAGERAAKPQAPEVKP